VFDLVGWAWRLLTAGFRVCWARGVGGCVVCAVCCVWCTYRLGGGREAARRLHDPSKAMERMEQTLRMPIAQTESLYDVENVFRSVHQATRHCAPTSCSTATRITSFQRRGRHHRRNSDRRMMPGPALFGGTAQAPLDSPRSGKPIQRGRNPDARLITFLN